MGILNILHCYQLGTPRKWVQTLWRSDIPFVLQLSVLISYHETMLSFQELIVLTVNPEHLIKFSNKQMIYSGLHFIFLWNTYYYEEIPDFLNIFIIPKDIYYFTGRHKFCCINFTARNTGKILERLLEFFCSKLFCASLDVQADMSRPWSAAGTPQWPKSIVKVPQSPCFWALHRGSWEGLQEDKIVIFIAIVDSKKKESL